jgi:hypothetical protein
LPVQVYSQSVISGDEREEKINDQCPDLKGVMRRFPISLIVNVLVIVLSRADAIEADPLVDLSPSIAFHFPFRPIGSREIGKYMESGYSRRNGLSCADSLDSCLIDMT